MKSNIKKKVILNFSLDEFDTDKILRGCKINVEIDNYTFFDFEECEYEVVIQLAKDEYDNPCGRRID